jgi:hypothetical protein
MKKTIPFENIHCWKEASVRNKNDDSNKIREATIEAIIKKQIPENYYEDESWKNLRNALMLCIKTNYKDLTLISCKHMGGRKYNYDFTFTFENPITHIKTQEKIEFKFNASRIYDCPQFSSPSKPSTFLTLNFEEYWYDNILSKIGENTGFKFPNKENYIKEINNNEPKCMLEFQTLYYKGCKRSSKFESSNETAIKFYKKCKKISKQGIREFMGKTTLKPDSLTNYLCNSQKEKKYLLYKDGTFKMETHNQDMFSLINDSITKNHNSFFAKTKSGHSLKILLRWKNGEGIAFPAFQIKQHIPSVKELKKICKDNNLNGYSKMKKNELVTFLNKNNIIV